jgi:2-polyprenyl-3-methyl-5-hydroxy-6-metoxy-1,4-benzoquinol methylase
MAARIAKNSLQLDRSFTDEEFASYQRLIEDSRSWGYYQRLVIEDVDGKRLETPGTHLCSGTLEALDRHGFPTKLTGKRVLDIGCNAGFYSFVAKLRGAASVLGLDRQEHYIDQALLMRQILGVDVDFRQSDGHDLNGHIGVFDVVINTGVIYHLQNPMDFLTKISGLTREMMYLETEALTDSKYTEYAWFIEGAYGQDVSNWWIYGPTCVERMVRAAGFKDVAFQGFVWKPPPGTKTPEGFLRQGRAAFVCRK